MRARTTAAQRFYAAAFALALSLLAIAYAVSVAP